MSHEEEAQYMLDVTPPSTTVITWMLRAKCYGGARIGHRRTLVGEALRQVSLDGYVEKQGSTHRYEGCPYKHVLQPY
jgi:hypothetical protein